MNTMKELFKARALFNKNAFIEISNVIKENQELLKKDSFSSSVFLTFIEDTNVYKYFVHLVSANAYIIKNLLLKSDESIKLTSITAERLDEIINEDTKLIGKDINFELIIKEREELDNALVEIIDQIDFDSDKWNDLSQDESPLVRLTFALDHEIYHRAQISHILAQHGLGNDTSIIGRYIFK